MKKQTVFLLSSLVISSSFAVILLTPKKFRHFAFTANEGIDKNLIESELNKKYTVTREFSEFAVFTFDSLKKLEEVQKSLEHLGEVELISTQQVKLLDFLRKLR